MKVPLDSGEFESIEISDEVIETGKVYVSIAYDSALINKKQAIMLIDHLQKVFNLKDDK